jgi:hypothetical protein
VVLSKRGLLAPFLLIKLDIFNDTNHPVWLKIRPVIRGNHEKHQDRSFLVKNHPNIRQLILVV